MSLFNIIFNGQIAAHTNPEQAKRLLAQQYQIDTVDLEALFDGQTHILKENLSNEQADQYLELLQQSGIIAQKQATPNPHRYTSEPPTPTQNPYATPHTTHLEQPNQAHTQLHFFNAKGRIGRMRMVAWSVSLILAVFAYLFVTTLLTEAIYKINRNISFILANITLALAAISWLVMQAFIIIKRLHDTNRSGWLYIITLIPVINIFFGLYLLCASGTENKNNYGEPPPPNKASIHVLFWLGITVMPIMLIGILAAIALPAYSDYTTRARVSEGLVFVKAAQQEVSMNAGDLQHLLSAINRYNLSEQPHSYYVERITIDHTEGAHLGEITITYSRLMGYSSPPTLVLSPWIKTGTTPVKLSTALTQGTHAINSNTVVWACNSSTNTNAVEQKVGRDNSMGTLRPRDAPAMCR